MSAIWGNKVHYTIFGESHGKGLGITIDGLPPGVAVDLDQVRNELARRAPGRNPLSTARHEDDAFNILSGFWQGKTTGTPLCAIIENQNQKSDDYTAISQKFRPGHADYSGYIKYQGHNDIRGGGHFSGRITAPLVFAGAIAKQLLQQHNIIIGSHVQKIHTQADIPFNPIEVTPTLLHQLQQQDFAVLDPEIGKKMQQKILSAKAAGDSVGGVIETAVLHCPAGCGNPFFDSLESTLSHLLFSIPAVKGVEFGTGFALAEMTGSSANDAMYSDNAVIKTSTNHNGGILGGITNGMPIIFRVVIKPTPSIALEQKTVNRQGENVLLTVGGRHDPCIVPRAIPVVEAVTAMAVWDML